MTSPRICARVEQGQWGLQPAQFDQQHHAQGVCTAGQQADQQFASPVAFAFAGQEAKRTALHQQDTDDVAEPVADHKPGPKPGWLDRLGSLGEANGKRQVEQKVVPPAQRRQQPAESDQRQRSQSLQTLGPVEQIAHRVAGDHRACHAGSRWRLSIGVQRNPDRITSISEGLPP